MARYALIADLSRAMGERDLVRFTNDDGGSTVDDDVAEGALEDACDTVDTYLSRRYTCPLVAPIPSVVRRITLSCAVYWLYSRRTALESGHPRRVDYDDAIAMLKDISAGKASLGIQPEARVKTSQVADFTSSTRIFSRDNLRGL